MKKFLASSATCAFLMTPVTAHASQTIDLQVPSVGYTSSMMLIQTSSRIMGMDGGCTTIPDPNGEPGAPHTQWIRCWIG